MKPLSLSRPHLIVLIGVPGAGKTTFAARFSETFRAPFVNPSDIQRLTFGTRGGDKQDETKAYVLAQLMLAEVLKTKQTILYEEPTGTRRARQDLSQHAAKAGYTPLFVWVQTDIAEASRRATRRAKDVISMTEDEFEQATRRFSAPVASEKAIVISGKHTYTTQLKNVLSHLTSERTAQPLEVPPRRPLIR